MAEEIVLQARLDTSQIEEGFRRLGQAASRAVLNPSSAGMRTLSTNLEALGERLEGTTEGFDRFRSALDAQGDRLRIFGDRGTAVANAIDAISDPTERLTRYNQELGRALSPTALDRAAISVGNLGARFELAAARLGPLLPLLGGVAGGVLAIGAAAAAYVAGAGAKYWQTQTDLVKVSTELERQQGRLALAVGEAAVEMTGAEQSGKRLAAALELLADGQQEANKSAEDYGDIITGLKVGIGVLLPPIGTTILAYEALTYAGDKAVEATQGVREQSEAAAEGFRTLIQQLEIQQIRLTEQKEALEAEIKTGHLSAQEKRERVKAYNELLTKEKILAAALDDARARSTSLFDRLQQLRSSLIGLKGDFAGAAEAALDFGKRAASSLVSLLAPRGGKAGGGGGGSKAASPWAAAFGEGGAGAGGAGAGFGAEGGMALSLLGPFVGAGGAGAGAGQVPAGSSFAEQGQQLAAAWASAKPAFEQAAEAQARLIQEGMRFDGMVGTVSRLTDGFASLGGQVAETLGVFAAGGGTLKGFGDAMLDAFGGLASQIGDFYLKLGIAMLAVGDPLGLGAIAGGLGLKALGGALGQKGSGNAKRGGGGRGAGPSSGDLTSRLPRDPRRGEQGSTTVNVIIDGDKVASSTGERARLGHLTLSPYAPRGARS